MTPRCFATLIRCMSAREWADTLVKHAVRTTTTTTTTTVAILVQVAMSVRDPSYSSERLWKVSGLCGSLGKMAKGVDIGAHGNCIFCVSRLGAAPSLLTGLVVLMFALALLLSRSSVISSVSLPSADMKFETVFAGETELSLAVGFFGLVEHVVVELGGFRSLSFGDTLCGGSL